MNLKNAVKYTFAVGAVVAGMATFAWACDLPENYMATTSSTASPNNEKVCVCHNAGPNKQKKTLCLPKPAADAHLRKGDAPGPCPNGR